MPNQPRADNPPRAVRIEDELWERARAEADEQGTSVGAIVRLALADYLRRNSRH